MPIISNSSVSRIGTFLIYFQAGLQTGLTTLRSIWRKVPDRDQGHHCDKQRQNTYRSTAILWIFHIHLLRSELAVGTDA